MTTEQYIKLQLIAEELRDRRGKSFQAVNDLYSNGFITQKQAMTIICKIRKEYIKQRLKIENKKGVKNVRN